MRRRNFEDLFLFFFNYLLTLMCEIDAWASL